MAEQYDLLVLGSGEAGKYLAWTLASKGKRVAVIEHKYYGGSCPNVACLPSKNLLHTAASIHTIQQASSYGIDLGPSISDTFRVNMQTVLQRRRNMIHDLMTMHEGRFAATGAEMVWGTGRFVGLKTVEVLLLDKDAGADGTETSIDVGTGTTCRGTRTLAAPNIIISTGSRAALPSSIPGLLACAPLTHITALELDVVPLHLVILGGGYVGLEFAQAMVRFGARVTIVERGERILKAVDADVSAALQGMLEREGVVFLVGREVVGVQGRSGVSVSVKLRKIGHRGQGTIAGDQDGAAGEELVASHLLVATGREPNTQDIGLESAGVSVNAKTGNIQVDEFSRTTAPGVYAVGDCAGSPHFTHVAFDDFRIVRDILLSPDGKPDAASRSTANRLIPSVLFTDPELAHVGSTEQSLQKSQTPYRVLKLPIAAFLRTRTLSQAESTGSLGFAKALIADDDTILGFTALGPGVGELLPLVQLAMNEKLKHQKLGEMIITHPTMAEGLVYLFAGMPIRAAGKEVAVDGKD